MARKMTVAGVELEEFDEVIITGTIVSEDSLPRVVQMPGTVSTLSEANADGPASIKVWPQDDKFAGLPDDHNGKLWFVVADVESVQIVHKWDED